MKLKRPYAFRKDIEKVLNAHGVDALYGVPDFVLADFIQGCLDAFHGAKADMDAIASGALTVAGGAPSESSSGTCADWCGTPDPLAVGLPREMRRCGRGADCGGTGTAKGEPR